MDGKVTHELLADDIKQYLVYKGTYNENYPII